MDEQLLSIIVNGFNSSEIEHFLKVEITPETARKMLQFNIGNIPEQKAKILKYSNLMSAGKWKFNGDAIRFSDNGKLIDGQNRLKGCVESGVTILTNVITGLPEDVFNTIDQGRVRYSSHLLAREYRADISNNSEARMISTAITKTLKHDLGFSQGSGLLDINGTKEKIKIDISVISDYFSKNTKIISQARYIKENYNPGIFPMATILFFYHMGSRFNTEFSKIFLAKSILGVGLESKETLSLLHNTLIKIGASKRWSALDKENTLIKVWNSIGKKGFKSITHERNLKISKRDDGPQFFSPPKEEVIFQMLNDGLLASESD